MHLDVFNSLRWKKYHDFDGLPGKLLCKRQSWIFSSRGKSFANGRAGVVTVNMFFSLDHQLVQRVEKPLFSLNKWSNLQIKTLARCIFNNHKNQRELVTMNIQHMHFVSENLIWILFFFNSNPIWILYEAFNPPNAHDQTTIGVIANHTKTTAEYNK